MRYTLSTMEMNLDNEAALVEAILFLESEPLAEKTIALIAELSEEVVQKALELLKEKYAAENSGLELKMITGGWALTPKKKVWDLVKERYGSKSEGRLSRSAMETLSIIAYSQPITRAEIEGIRGVSADNMIRLLAERNLIKEVGKKDVPVSGKVGGWDEYDTVYLGFPIWYYGAPNVVSTFCREYDWTGKKIYIFATSGSSGIGKTAEKLAPYIKGGEIADAKRVTSASEVI